MTDFNDWYAQQNPWIDPERDDCLAELRKAYEAGAASQVKTRRDEFAGQALAGDMATSDEGVFLNDVDGKYLLARATLLYRMADAMLEARKTTGEGEA
jgi:hypothetical protein